MSIDTVQHAIDDPEHEQPFAELGLKPDEYARIREILGRRPTNSELAMYSVMWSEHCSYKSQQGPPAAVRREDQPRDARHLLVGIGENAGVVDIGDGWAVTFKVESHNHPIYVEPYQGAATGVGGIVRDIISMGARPVAVMDQLRFGAIDAPRHRPRRARRRRRRRRLRQLPGPAEHRRRDGVRPVLPGQPARQRARASGVMRHEDIHLASAKGVGNLVVLFGARTGGDGIGGVSVLASETFDDGGPTKRPGVQVGDPFMEKVLIECTLEVLHAGLVEGIQDLGGAGSRCATSELASQRRRRHARLARPRAAARRHADARGDPHERVAGADVRGRHPCEARRVHRDLRASGTSRPSSSARSPTAAA